MFANQPSSRWYRWILVVVCLGLTVPLVGYIWTGLYARYLQDDYCYSVFLRGDNFFTSQWNSYFYVGSYSANRYSLTLLIGISEAIGRFTVGLMPGLAVVLWVVGFMVLFRQAARLARMDLGWLEVYALSAALVYLALYQAPNRTQILYWRAAMLPYLAPLVTQTWLAAWILRQGCREKTGVLAVIGLVLMAFLAAGFSETGATYQAGMLGVGILAALIFWGRKQTAGKRFLLPLGAAMVGTLLGIAALVFSPVNAGRMGSIYPEAQSLMGVLSISIDSLIRYLQHWVYRVTLPTFFTFLLFTAFGWAIFLRYARPARLGFWQLAVGLVGIQALHLFLMFCEMVPSAYAQSSAPGERALLAARFTSVITTAASGFLVGAWLARNFRQGLVRWAAVPGLAVLSLAGVVLLFLATPTMTLEPAYPDMRAYVLGSPAMAVAIIAGGLLLGGLLAWVGGKAPGWTALVLLVAALAHVGFATETIYARIPEFRFRAEMWDMRDAQIWEMAGQGQREIEVRALDSLDGIAELQGTPDNWMNNCAEIYYGVDALWAVEPVLNPP